MKRAVMRIVVLACVAASCAALPALASAKGKTLCCVQHLHFAAGPYTVHSGANAIFIDLNVPKPKVDGYMLRMVPNLHYALPNGKCCGAIPFVDIVHLHHGVWLSTGKTGMGEGNNGYSVGGLTLYPFMATGEEKTIYSLPKGYGYPIGGSDDWFFNYMIHDLIPTPAKVYVTYEVDFVPESTPLAKTLTAAHPIWMDVEDREIYPVFNVLQHSGVNGKFTFPEMAKNPYPAPQQPRNLFTVDQSGVLLDTAGHVHPGGLYTQLDDTRAGVKPRGGALPGMTKGSVRLFRSNAHYWDKRGPISWDMAMKGTSLDWRPAVKKGDVLSVSATYETKRASWYESMGIMVVWEAWNSQRGIDVFTGRREAHPANPTYGGINPFTHALDQVGHVTHGRLPENIDDGGTSIEYKINLNSLPDCSAPQVTISHYVYNPGGFQATGKNRCMPDDHPGPDGDVRQPGRPVGTGRGPRVPVPAAGQPVRQRDLPHGDLVPEPVRVEHRHLVSAGQRHRPLRLRSARHRHARHRLGRVVDAEGAQARHLHVLLPDPPVHARRLPGRGRVVVVVASST